MTPSERADFDQMHRLLLRAYFHIKAKALGLVRGGYADDWLKETEEVLSHPGRLVSGHHPGGDTPCVPASPLPARLHIVGPGGEPFVNDPTAGFDMNAKER